MKTNFYAIKSWYILETPVIVQRNCGNILKIITYSHPDMKPGNSQDNPTLSPSLLADLKQHGTIKELEEGDLLFREHSSIHSVPIVLEGSVKIYQTDDDFREMLLYYLKEGETCIMSILDGLYNEDSKIKAIAHEKTRILLIPVHKLGVLTKNYPQWVDYIFRAYHLRFRELLDVVNAVAFKKMDERLMTFLTQKAELLGSNTLEITHDELAWELGTARVVISRLLKKMEEENLITLARNKITLL